MTRFANPAFWSHYRQLPEDIQRLADKNFLILKDNPNHPSIRLKKVGKHWSARVGIHYRAIAKDHPRGLVSIWIGHHSAYDRFDK
jgi:hypothetical protein